MEQKISLGFTIDFHFKFNVDTNTRLYEKNFPAYINALKEAGTERVVIHRPRQLGQKAVHRLEDMTDKLHTAGLKTVLYTGVFGQENLEKNPLLEPWVQRNGKGELLSYRNAGKIAAMMCPASAYIVDYLAPKVAATLNVARFDSMFLDIPWIMKGGCYCNNCSSLRKHGAGNSELVRHGLESFVHKIRKEFPSIPIGVNSSAPGIYLHSWHGAEIDNLIGLFQEYITEWTPYQWGQKAEMVTRCINAAKERGGTDQGERFYHATVCKDMQGNLYSEQKLSALFNAILSGGALPWLCVNATEEQLKNIGKALQAKPL